MASIRIKQLAMEVQAALPSAEKAMVQAAQWLSCRDQDKDLKAAVDEVLHTLRGELSMERSARANYSRGQDQQGQTPQAPPFGRVLVAVGPKGVPDGLKVLNISSMSRAEGASELVVEKRLVTQGKLLITPKAFEQRMDWLAAEILAGRIGLPYHPQGANI